MFLLCAWTFPASPYLQSFREAAARTGAYRQAAASGLFCVASGKSRKRGAACFTWLDYLSMERLEAGEPIKVALKASRAAAQVP